MKLSKLLMSKGKNRGKEPISEYGKPRPPSETNSIRRNNAEKQIDSVDGIPQPNIGGAVGVAYGRFSRNPPLKSGSYSTKDVMDILRKSLFPTTLIPLLAFFTLYAIPYIIMKLLTNFDKRQRTKSQRTWILVWLAFSQYFGPVIALLRLFIQKFSRVKIQQNPAMIQLWMLCNTVLLSVPSIGVFVIVGKMILDDVVCTKI